MTQHGAHTFQVCFMGTLEFGWGKMLENEGEREDEDWGGFGPSHVSTYYYQCLWREAWEVRVKSCFTKTEILVTNGANSRLMTETSDDLSSHPHLFLTYKPRSLSLSVVCSAKRRHFPTFLCGGWWYLSGSSAVGVPLHNIFKDTGMICPNFSETLPLSTCCSCIIIKSILFPSPRCSSVGNELNGHLLGKKGVHSLGKSDLLPFYIVPGIWHSSNQLGL